MADPFEVRMRFSMQLQHLSASVTAAQKAANYALKNREMDEDLHSCILEQLEKTSMNTRANIMYFIEHLCALAQRENHPEYIRMMQRDIIRVIDAVCPLDGSGAANIRVVRRVLQGLQAQKVLMPETVTELEAELKSREGTAHPFIAGADDGGDVVAAEKNGGPVRLDKRQIEQRIEEDRERHKRLREEIWAVSDEPDGDGELRKMWDEASDIGDDDYLAAEEDQAERRQ
ncbi:uncharacterized protein EI97DRAFT_362861, partial [Westerdykella ornata]